MEFLVAVVLGVVQGVTEFLPVSSSGHLAILEHMFDTDVGGITFNVAVHVGSLLAVVLVLRQEWWLMATALVGRAGAQTAFGRRLFLLLIVASLPVAVTGLLLKDTVEAAFSSPFVPGVMLLVTGFLLWYADRTAGSGTLEDVTPRRALFMGLGQAAALLPGLSRSGTTMATGIFSGLGREAAARFSFLMAVPAVFGAALVEGKELFDGQAAVAAAPGVIAAGLVASLVTSYVCIRFFLAFLRRGRLIWFARYVWAVGALVLALAAFGV